jgi:hypothetical protein
LREGEKLPGLSEAIRLELERGLAGRKAGATTSAASIEVIPKVTRQVQLERSRGPDVQLLSVTWRLLDVSGRVLASDTASQPSRDFPLDLSSRSPEARLLREGILALTVGSIQPRLLPTLEAIQIDLAEGKLSEGCSLGKSGRWNDALAFFLRVPVFPNPKDESYRLYNIGIAHEVLAYNEDGRGNAAGSRTHIEETRRLLTEALRLNPGEKTYAAAHSRVAEWIAYAAAR